jgi:hypothetical protein
MHQEDLQHVEEALAYLLEEEEAPKRPRRNSTWMSGEEMARAVEKMPGMNEDVSKLRKPPDKEPFRDILDKGPDEQEVGPPIVFPISGIRESKRPGLFSFQWPLSLKLILG